MKRSRSRHVAFLRAINVGGHTVKMDHLRSLFEAMGLSNVETFIASGNIIFDSTTESAATLEKRIEDHLRDALGYSVATFLRSISDLADIAEYWPSPGMESGDEATDAARPGLYVAFVAHSPGDDASQKLLSFTTDVDEFHVHGREVYWLCRTRMSDSKFSGALLERTLGMQATIRNATTVRKIVAKYA